MTRWQSQRCAEACIALQGALRKQGGRGEKRRYYFFRQSILSEDWPLPVYAPTTRLPACPPALLSAACLSTLYEPYETSYRGRKSRPFLFRPRAGCNESRDLDGARDWPPLRRSGDKKGKRSLRSLSSALTVWRSRRRCIFEIQGRYFCFIVSTSECYD